MSYGNLLSIGALSKITGIHIKALRYYDRLGILKPVYVDPASGYRYYAFCQKAMVDAIQFCVELGIPLREFSKYTNEEAPFIRYRELVDDGAALVQARIAAMQRSLARLQAMQAEIERSEDSNRRSQPGLYTLPERRCLLTPYEGTLGCDASDALLRQLIEQIRACGLRLGNSNGLLLHREDGAWRQFLFVDVAVPDGAQELPGLLYIPRSPYLCKRVTHSGVRRAWDWCLPLVPEEEVGLVIENELFVGNYAFSKPVLEQRCLLTPAGVARCASLFSE